MRTLALKAGCQAVLLCSLVGCSTVPMPVRIELSEPQHALIELTLAEKRVVEHGFSFRFDARNMVVLGPFVDGTDGRRPLDYLEVDVHGFLGFFNERLVRSDVQAIKINVLRIHAGDLTDTGRERSLISLEIRDENGRLFTGRSAGDTFSVISSRSAYREATSRSSSIAFLAALLKAAVAIERQLQAEGAGHSAAPNDL
jgi:hypothetical protein